MGIQLWGNSNMILESSFFVDKGITLIFSDNQYIYVEFKGGEINIYTHPRKLILIQGKNQFDC